MQGLANSPGGLAGFESSLSERKAELPISRIQTQTICKHVEAKYHVLQVPDAQALADFSDGVGKGVQGQPKDPSGI